MTAKKPCQAIETTLQKKQLWLQLLVENTDTDYSPCPNVGTLETTVPFDVLGDFKEMLSLARPNERTWNTLLDELLKIYEEMGL